MSSKLLFGLALRIASGDQIEGVTLPSRSVSRSPQPVWKALFRQRLRLSKPRADKLIVTLQCLKFMKPLPTPLSSREVTREWLQTEQGIRLGAATAAKPIRRATADRLLSDLLERIKKLNGDDHFRVVATIGHDSEYGIMHHRGCSILVDIAMKYSPRSQTISVSH
jgi:hypothetical protein